MFAKVALILILVSLFAAAVAWRPGQAHAEGPQGCENVFPSTTRGGGQLESSGGFSYNIFGESSEAVRVARVIGGDTIDLAGGQRVRLIGVDTPEPGQPFYDKAAKFMEDLLLSKKVAWFGTSPNGTKAGRSFATSMWMIYWSTPS